MKHLIVSKDNFVQRLRHQHAKAEDELQIHWRGCRERDIDEMSLLFSSQTQMMDYRAVILARGTGWEERRVVQDAMMCTTPSPFENKSFGVEFAFWHHRDVPYRIEAMFHTPGFASPLHDHALAIHHGLPTIIHASFKLSDLEHYQEVIAMQPEPPTLSYRNSYGQFSYFGTGPTYIKPRVNLRD